MFAGMRLMLSSVILLSVSFPSGASAQVAIESRRSKVELGAPVTGARAIQERTRDVMARAAGQPAPKYTVAKPEFEIPGRETLPQDIGAKYEAQRPPGPARTVAPGSSNISS